MTEAALVFIGMGLAFNLFGCLGLVRLPDVYNRLQAATKCVTLGTCSILFGVLLISGWSDTGIKSLLTIAFILLTAPVAAHAIARGCRRGGVPLWSGSVVDTYPFAGSSPSLTPQNLQGSDASPVSNGGSETATVSSSGSEHRS
jgi:multicomponent Na+:H+ antiporter subunit G